MATWAELVRTRTALDADDVEWLHRLLGQWQLLADLSFADLLLWVPVADAGPDPAFLVVAQMRPTTGPTSFHEDLVGTVAPAGRRPQVDTAYREGRICREGDPEWRDRVPVREETIPVRRGQRVIAVVARHTNLAAARTPSRLEIAYLQSAAELAQMVAEGRFPIPSRPEELATEPRVGDGLIRLDAAGQVTFASPNAVSAYRRLGFAGDLVGTHLGAVTAGLVVERGPLDEPVAAVVEGRVMREREVDAGDAVVALQAIPLAVGGARSGALVLVRDVSELRLRDRQLLSKDATIREIHHRVKNNLQTVAALLRLQARRLSSPEARAALGESVRRVSSIALVHETLAQTPTDADEVEFDAIVDQVLAMVAEVAAPEARVHRRRSGSFGVLPAAVATPLALVLTELLQNAIEHGLAAGGTVEVAARRADGRLVVQVCDDGRGLPDGFALEASPRLGLQIVRTLVEGELAGTLTLRGRDAAPGTQAELTVPLRS